MLFNFFLKRKMLFNELWNIPVDVIVEVVIQDFLKKKSYIHDQWVRGILGATGKVVVM
jgi:hypothetical protein